MASTVIYTLKMALTVYERENSVTVLIAKGSSIFFIIIPSVQNVRWGEGVQGWCTVFQKFKSNNIISAKSSFYYFSICTLLGEGAKRVRFVCL